MKNHRNELAALAITCTAAFSTGMLKAEMVYLDLGGPASGYIAVVNFKNSASQDGIENKNGETNGLPDYPNYQIPTGQTNAGVWTAIIVSPQFSGADFSALYGNDPGVTVNNLVINDPNYATMSAGLIGFDKSLLTGVGTEIISVADLTFNFDTYNWDGKTANGWTVFDSPVNISPFSPVYTEYNDGGGAGNAGLVYNLSVSNVTGTGVTFQDGVLVSLDIDADLSVLLRAGYIPNPTEAFGATFTGTFSASGLDYQFNVDETQSAFIISNAHMVMNRAGTVSVVPEPSTYALLGGLVLAGALWVRRKNRAQG